ncbi:hypothetical protein AB0J86_25005 [Micromonospora sp. NPDC049559]|uniref:hypothetical protein n=1 Tax=Micromonospora sp. NPDC049559 TaxID=3155923 RepID=UPI00343A38B1
MRKIPITLTLAALTTAAVVIPAGPAAAAVPGLVRISEVSASNSDDVRSVTATCPVDTVALSGGYEINGATGEVTVTYLRPNTTSVSAIAYEEDAFASNWTLTTYAVCATEPAGLLHITASGSSNSNDFKSVPATCSAGDGLIGLGFSVGATGEAVVDDFRPNGGTSTAPTSVTVGAYEAEAYAGNWAVTTYGVCANTLPGLVRASASSTSSSTDYQSATASCPAGTVLVGSGFEVNGATGEVVVDDFRPNGGASTAPTSVTVGAYEAEAYASNWWVTAYANCATA